MALVNDFSVDELSVNQAREQNFHVYSVVCLVSLFSFKSQHFHLFINRSSAQKMQTTSWAESDLKLSIKRRSKHDSHKKSSKKIYELIEQFSKINENFCSNVFIRPFEKMENIKKYSRFQEPPPPTIQNRGQEGRVCPWTRWLKLRHWCVAGYIGHFLPRISW